MTTTGRTIRYVTSLQLDVNRYIRPTALLDDVINMCVTAHEIMTLLRGMQLSTRVLHSTIMSTVYDTVNRLWFLQCVLCTVIEPVSGGLSKPIGYSAVIEHPRCGVLYNFSVDSVCLSVCQTITFVGGLGSHIRYVSRRYRLGSYMKVIGSRSRSQKPKDRKFLFPHCKLRSPITPVL